MCCTCMPSLYISDIFRATVHVGAYVQMNAGNIPRNGETRKQVSRILPVNIQPAKERFSLSGSRVMEKGPNGVSEAPRHIWTPTSGPVEPRFHVSTTAK